MWPPFKSWLARSSHFAIPLVILLPVVWALLPGGLPNSADGMVHFTRITEIVSSWRDGILIPRWSLNLGFGYGIPVFVFGPPLAYWIGAAYNLLGFDPEAAYKAMLVTVLFIGAMGTYKLGKVLLGFWAGVIAAIAFIYAPNQLFTLFVQGNAPQLLAWSLMPWAMWATIQIYRALNPPTRLRYALALALTVSATLLSHNVVSLILIPTIAALSLLLWGGTRNHAALWFTAAGGALGGLFSAWFVVPALLETVYASTDAIVASDYHGRFVPLLELLSWPPRMDVGAINPYIPRTLGLPLLAIALVGVAFLILEVLLRNHTTCHKLEHERATDAPIFWATALFMLLYALFGAYMATQWSTPVWENLTILEFLQFPARWIGFAVLGLVWLAAAAVGLMERKLQPIFATLLAVLLIISAMVNLYPDKTPVGTRQMSAHDVVRYELRSGAIGTTSYGEFNPRWAPRPLQPSPMVDDYMAGLPVDRLKGMLPEGASHRVEKVTAHQQQYTITLPTPATISLNLLYFPGWQATANGAPVEIWPQERTGLITLALPAGESRVDLTFGPTPLRRAMGIVSSSAWILLLTVGVVLTVRTSRTRRQAAPSQLTADPYPLGAIGLLGATMFLMILVHQTGQEEFLIHSQVDEARSAPIQRHEDIGARFRLLGQNPVPTTVRAGSTLPVVAYWRALVEMDENYPVVLQLDDATDGHTVLQMEQANPSDIPTSGWATGLYLRNEWQMPIPEKMLPVQYVLRIGFRDPATGNLLPTAQGTTLELGRLWILPEDKTRATRQPNVYFGQIIELLGAEVAHNDESDSEVLNLYWRANAPVTDEYTIFIHLLDAEGKLVGQLDGLPFGNSYPIREWLVGETFEDQRNITAAGYDINQIKHIRVGIYHPATQTRLAANDASSNPVADNAANIEVK